MNTKILCALVGAVVGAPASAQVMHNVTAFASEVPEARFNASSPPILVDFGEGAAAPTLGGVWNTVDFGLSGASVVDALGAPTGVTVNFGGSWFDSGVDQGAWPAGDTGWVDGDATADYVFNTSGDTSTVTFSGLTPGEAYTLEHVSARSIGATRIADYLVQGNFADSVPNGDDFASLTDGWDGGSILVWNNVIANISGDITLTVTNVQDFGYVNATRLQMVPTPASAAMLGLGGLFAARRRRC